MRKKGRLGSKEGGAVLEVVGTRMGGEREGDFNNKVAHLSSSHCCLRALFAPLSLCRGLRRCDHGGSRMP